MRFITHNNLPLDGVEIDSEMNMRRNYFNYTILIFQVPVLKHPFEVLVEVPG